MHKSSRCVTSTVYPDSAGPDKYVWWCDTRDCSSVNNLKRDDAPKYRSHLQQI